MKKVLSLLVGRDDGFVKSYFGIEYDNKLWLVNAWLIDRATNSAIPERMIRIDNLPSKPQDVSTDSSNQFDYMNILLPKDVIEGANANIPGFEIHIMPNEPKISANDLYTLPSI